MDHHSPEDFWGRTQLARLAFMGQDVEAAKKIINNAPGCINQKGSAYGETPLLIALSGGRASIAFLNLLVENGADITVTYAGGKNILHCVANTTNLDHLNYILTLKNCPDINSQTDNGCTPLHAVCMQGISTATIDSRKKMAAKLLDAGANLTISNNAWCNPSDEAMAQGLDEIAEYINTYTPLKKYPSFTPIQTNLQNQPSLVASKSENMDEMNLDKKNRSQNRNQHTLF